MKAMIRVPPPVGVVIVMTGCLLLFTGCATTSPGASFAVPLPAEKRLDSNDSVTVDVQSAESVAIIDQERQRLAQSIKMKVDQLKMANPGGRDARQYHVAVLLTRYDKGNAFARAMLAGLGQIHIDARVAVYAMPQKARVADFTVNKTFAWGGIYGASQSIDDVEQGFAEGVAEAVTKSDE